jgi:hypothetical protein
MVSYRFEIEPRPAASHLVSVSFGLFFLAACIAHPSGILSADTVAFPITYPVGSTLALAE